MRGGGDAEAGDRGKALAVLAQKRQCLRPNRQKRGLFSLLRQNFAAQGKQRVEIPFLRQAHTAQNAAACKADGIFD